MSAISVTVDYVKLAIAIDNLKSLKDGTGYDKNSLTQSLNGCIGLAADRNKELFTSLFKIEELLIEIVGKTQVALQNAGIKFSESEDMISSIFDAVGTVVIVNTSINYGEKTIHTSSQLDNQVGNNTSMPVANDGRNIGQCVGYAYCRFKYLYPNVNINAGNANQWLNNNRINSSVTVVNGGWENIAKITTPCIAVTKGAPYEGVLYGHVMVVEDVTYNDNGSIKDIYYSESNGYDYNTGTLSSNGIFNDGIDGTIQKRSYSEFVAQDSHSVQGFIIPNI